MSCKTVTTVQEAEAQIPASLFPIQGLRRGGDGMLTPDALRTVVDGIKSRGIDPKDPASKRELLRQIEIYFCSVNNQYQFLVETLLASERADTRHIDAAIQKNQLLRDILSILRHVQAMGLNDESSSFIEAWQDAGATATAGQQGLTPDVKELQKESALLSSANLNEMKRQRLRVSEEKNRAASNYVGLYGFLNLVAVGILIYAFSASSGGGGQNS